jgi:ribosome-interacting GTPase 1
MYQMLEMHMRLKSLPSLYCSSSCGNGCGACAIATVRRGDMVAICSSQSSFSVVRHAEVVVMDRMYENCDSDAVTWRLY